MAHANLPETEPALVTRARAFGAKVALIDDAGCFTYAQLLARSERAAAGLLRGRTDLACARVALLLPPSVDYVVAQWAVWRAGGVVVPLCITHPAPELAHVIDDAAVSSVIVHPELRDLVQPLAAERSLELLDLSDLDVAATALPNVRADQPAMLLYTSGTTGKPKGVVSTHAAVVAQLQSVTSAWEWSGDDRILHVLPLHHLHGVLVGLCASLWAGGVCELLPRFDAERVWQRLQAHDGPSLFMGVPTMYAKLLQHFEQAPVARQARMREGCRRLRLMVSGSAALPVGLSQRFAALSGHVLLERYGMTEFGLGLGNPLHGERRPGCVGRPFPGIEVRLVDDVGCAVVCGAPGHLQVRGPGVFLEYFGKPEATAEAFTSDGWFRTGDVAVREQGAYRILGRASTDILKTGGYKVSALEIEEALREHPAVAECAVVGVEDAEWGQRVAAAIVLHDGAALELAALRTFCKQRLAPYKAPTLLRVVSTLPKNALGKVQKRELAQCFA